MLSGTPHRLVLAMTVVPAGASMSVVWPPVSRLKR